MKQNTWVILFLSLLPAQGYAYMSTREITRLPSCHDVQFAQKIARKTLHAQHIEYELKSVKLLSVIKTTYKEFPEEYYCQGIISYVENGERVKSVFIYRIGWENSVVRKLQVKSTIYPTNQLGS